MHGLIKQMVLDRFDVLSHEVETLPQYAAIKEESNAIEHIIFAQVSPDTTDKLKAWLELQTQMDALQREWLYIKGVKDGIEMLMYLLHADETLVSK
ncbi:hypothetical protein [Paenibacillus xerothermodurans]|uniref:Uncharacterized protein n=1 Tax=Paenibacillus xerothermodurans TaxID=1977292 RepID=A0A2W1N7K9_PAEXE|nr:hypothetical protein [Paenibacillus xerothermodurans]PZE19824.1 hypothetical protein CBW46_015950 [Paenibacillus xerothermodurans]